MKRCRATILAFITCQLVTTLAWGQAHPHTRDGFMVGFGIGGGSLGFEDADARKGSVMGNFRIGYAARPDLVLHFESNAWTRTFDDEFLGIADDGITEIFGDVNTTVQVRWRHLRTMHPERASSFAAESALPGSLWKSRSSASPCPMTRPALHCFLLLGTSGGSRGDSHLRHRSRPHTKV